MSNPPTYNPNQKFRPYFSGEELLEIIQTFKQHPSPKRMGITRYLESFLLKINHGIVNPAHTTQLSTVQKLGFDEVLNALPTREQVLYSAWIKVTANPSSATSKEIEACMEYKYLNKLMTPAEEREFENMNGLQTFQMEHPLETNK